jgi:hypothetical protein
MIAMPCIPRVAAPGAANANPRDHQPWFRLGLAPMDRWK